MEFVLYVNTRCQSFNNEKIENFAPDSVIDCRKLWDALTGDELHSFEHKHIARACAFSEVLLNWPFSSNDTVFLISFVKIILNCHVSHNREVFKLVDISVFLIFKSIG